MKVRSRSMIVVGVAIGLGAAGATWMLMPKSERVSIAAQPRAVAEPPRPALPAESAQVAPSPAQPAPPAPAIPGPPGRVVLPSTPTPEMIAQFSDAHKQILASASACLTGTDRGSAAESVEVQYHLVVANGAASVADIEPVLSSITDAGIYNCVIDRVRNLRYATTGDKLDANVQDRILVADLLH